MDIVDRRTFLKSLASSLSLTMIDWEALPSRLGSLTRSDERDVIVIGSGLGGLSCAAAFARQGFRPLVLEQHDRPGGYATTFTRPGGFVFDVSLHSTTASERDGVQGLIPGFPEIRGVEFVPHPTLYRALYPEHDVRVPQRDLKAYAELLARWFPPEESGIRGLIEDMQGLGRDIQKFSAAHGQVDMSRFPQEFPVLARVLGKTWGEMMSARITDPRLQAILSTLWSYYGLPPSKLSAFYYALPTIDYLSAGGCYVKGRSQAYSNAFVSFIKERVGEILLGTRVEKILTKGGAAYGVRTAAGREFTARAVVSNASAHDTFHAMVGEPEVLKDYLGKLDALQISLSSFQVFLGLKKDLVGELGLKDTEIFVETGYDHEESYRRALEADIERGGVLAALYDNVYPGYSPKGKNTLSLMTLQGYDHWKQYEKDYLAGRKTAYRAEKERMARVLIQRAEHAILPGLSKAIEVMEIGTPLTNLRYTGNTRGAIYGFDQTLDNSGANRLPHATPMKNLYLSGAWTRPGHGYGGVIGSGLECFTEIMKTW